ncbi:ATP-binding protein [Ghiorsea bivora]|uniref:ATP-binding protein n=1 Tax=Ghiorsea bivora TaxID=1485545 RepID=UPI0012FE59BB|nr:ATP-binding protein [Ghiorsea bivora]
MSIFTEEESTSFDCKKSFYKLPETKVEMAKDIAAMANSTLKKNKNSTILIGRKEGDFYNVSYDKVPDEAEIQQTINSMLDPPVQFNVKRVSHVTEQGTFSLLQFVIPYSSRKPHLFKKFSDGRLKKNFEGQCYVRRGSSTAIANRVELAEIIHDADGSLNPYRKLIAYVEAQQKAGVHISTKELESLLFKGHHIPSLSIPMRSSGYSQTNSFGVSVYREMLSHNISEEHKNLFIEMTELMDADDNDLAEITFNKIVKVEESLSCCIAGGVLFSRLKNSEKSEELFKRAFDLAPDYAYLNFRYAEKLYLNNNEDKSILFFERCIQFCDDSSLDILSGALYCLAIIYVRNHVVGRAEELLKKFLSIHLEEDNERLTAQDILAAINSGEWREIWSVSESLASWK